MNKTPQIDKKPDLKEQTLTWGPKLFIVTLLVILTFFYWLLIYSGGVTPHHG